MGSNTFPQQQSMGQMPPQMAPMQQQDQQTGFSGMYSPQYNMQGYGGGQVARGYEQSMPPAQSYEVPQSVPNYQVPQVQQQPMQYNRYGVSQANKTVLY